MLPDYHDAQLWNTPFAVLNGKTPRQWLAPEGAGGFTFHAYVKGEYGQRLMENLLPWLRFGGDNMNPELLAYWRERGVEKQIHENKKDPDRTWFAYLPLHREEPEKPLPVWYLNHVKHRDILDIEAWGFVRYVASRQIMVITAEDGNSEQIFSETLAAAEARYPVDKSRIYLVGHSLSGSCAGRLAIAFADRLAGLCMLGSQYGGQNSAPQDIRRVHACGLPRIDIHGMAERILPYNKTLGRPSPQIYANVTPTDMGLDASFSEQQFWRGLNRCRPIQKEEMACMAARSGDPVERRLGIPVDKSRVFALGSVRHFAGDILNKEGLSVMRVIGVEGAPHYPSAYAGRLALDYLSRFSRDSQTGAGKAAPQSRRQKEMGYDTYEEKWLWDTPMMGLVDEATGILLPQPPTLRQRRLGSVVHHSDFDIEKHINSEDGMLQARQWHNVATCQEETAPQVLAYWEKLGWKKLVHNGDDYDKKWSCLVPLSSLQQENSARLYPLYFVLHGGNTPPYEMEGYGFCEPTAKDEPIIAIPHDFSIAGVLEVYQYCIAHYPVDKSRVYVTSYCGGNHANFVALRYPELFAAIAPCGNPLRENYKPVLWYPDYERVRRLGLPCCHMDGLDDLTQLLPLYQEGDPSLSDDPAYPGRIHNMPLAKRAYKVNTLRDYLFLFDCKDVTPEEVYACAHSQDDAVRLVGAPADETEVRVVHGKKHYACKFRNSDGNLWLEIVGIESMGHFPDSTLGKGAWEFLRQFRRNQETGRIEVIGAQPPVFTKDPGAFDHDRYLHDDGCREHGYNTAWDGRGTGNGI